MKKKQQNSYTIFFLFLMCCNLLLFCRQAIAFLADLEPEGDVGLAEESLPASDKQEIPVLTIKTVTGKPHIDGHIDDKFWEQVGSFDLNIEL
jgi:hypothetical protein